MVNHLSGPYVFHRVPSEAVASRLLEMFRTNDPKAGFGFLLMHPYSSRMLGKNRKFSLPAFDVVDGASLDLRCSPLSRQKSGRVKVSPSPC